jgi:hypothetical protein
LIYAVSAARLKSCPVTKDLCGFSGTTEVAPCCKTICATNSRA